MKLNVFIKGDYIDKDGKAPIVIDFRYKKKRHRINTKIKVSQSTFLIIYDEDLQSYRLGAKKPPLPLGERDTMIAANKELQNFLVHTNQIITDLQSEIRPINAKEITLEYCRRFPREDWRFPEHIETLTPVIVKEKTLLEYYGEFITEKEKEMKSGIASYRATRNHFAKFCSITGLFEMKISDLKRKVINEFRIYLSETLQLEGPTIHKQFNNLRIFATWIAGYEEEENGIVLYVPQSLNKLKVTAKFGDPIGLSLEQFIEFYKADLTQHPDLSIIRDLFVFGVSIGGPRHGDLVQIGRAIQRLGYRVENDQLCYYEMKTGNAHKKVSLNAFGIEILRKYDGAFPSVPNNTDMNAGLKRIAVKLNWNEIKFIPRFDEFGNLKQIEEIPLKKIFTSKFMRKVAATVDTYLGIPHNISMARTGHTSYAAYKRYVDVNGDMLQMANDSWSDLHAGGVIEKNQPESVFHKQLVRHVTQLGEESEHPG